jgi:hypothetical protein
MYGGPLTNIKFLYRHAYSLPTSVLHSADMMFSFSHPNPLPPCALRRQPSGVAPHHLCPISAASTQAERPVEVIL